MAGDESVQTIFDTRWHMLCPSRDLCRSVEHAPKIEEHHVMVIGYDTTNVLLPLSVEQEVRLRRNVFLAR